MILIGGIWSGVRAAAVKILIMLESGIYNVAAYCFKIFLILSDGTIIDTDTYSSLLSNVYIIIGIVMLFVIAFALLQAMVNPDNQKSGTSSMGKMIVNFVTSLLIIVLLPTIFTFLYDVQSAVISYNTIGRFFGYGSTEQATTVETASRKIVNAVWTAFFNVTEEYASNEGNGCSLDNTSTNSCQSLIKNDDNSATLQEVIAAVDSGSSFNKYGQFADTIIDGDIDFNILICLVAGLALIYVGISYCFDMALRLVKLIFFQLIAPVPIILRIIPGDKWSSTFNTWMKKTLSCYFEVYVRILVLYLCVYVCNLVINSDWLSATLTSYGGLTWLLTRAFLLMGIVMFMRQAPKLLSEVTGIESGGMSLGIRNKLQEGGAFAAGAVLGGAATAGVRNFASGAQEVGNAKGVGNKLKAIGKIAPSSLAGFASGAGRAVGSGALTAKDAKEMKNAASSGARGATDAKAKRANYKAAHGNSTFKAIGGHIVDTGKSVINWGADSSIQGLSAESQQLGALASAYSNHKDNIDNMLISETEKGDGSIFDLTNGDNTIDMAIRNQANNFKKAYGDYQTNLAKFKAGNLTQSQLNQYQSLMEQEKKQFRLLFDNMYGNGDRKGANNGSLSSAARATFGDIRVSGKALETELLRNASSSVVQDTSAGALNKIYNKQGFTFQDLESSAGNLKDVAKDKKSDVDMKIATKQAENAAKGDDKK